MNSLDEMYEGGPKTWNEAFPPVCITAHWDPTLITDRILPRFTHSMPYDPRQSTRICYRYYSLSQENTPEEKAQDKAHANDYMFPPGGAAGKGFPYEQYSANIDRESDLWRLGESLTKCAEKRYIPEGGVAPATISTHNVPGAIVDNSTTLSPLVTTVQSQAGCRNADDQAAWNRSSRLFANPTRYDRTTSVPDNLKKSVSRYALACS